MPGDAFADAASPRKRTTPRSSTATTLPGGKTSRLPHPRRSAGWLVKVVLGREGERLGEAEAAAVEDGDQRAVADPGRRAA
jgi:hypothetical protein